MATTSSNPRLARLLRQVLDGKHHLRNSSDAKLLIEAICGHHSASSCVELLMASPVGLTELGTALRLDIGPSFINGSANDLLRFFQNPAIKDLCNGQFLRQIIANIVDPPTFWNILIAQNRDGIMTDPVTQSFAWLLFELISDSNNNNTEYASLAEKMTTSRRFLDSGAFETRILGQKIKHVLDTLKGPVHDYINGPGGRHDNDMVDFRAISILPTADELSSSEPAFLRRASEVGNLDEHDRIGAHLDNQFRLLREDLLGELRDDLQAIINLKRAPRGTKLSGLELSGTHCGSDRKRKPFGLVFRCPKGITQLSKLKSKERKDYLGRNKNFLKHGSIACLLSDDHIVAFAQVERDEDLLAEEKPRVILIFSGEEAPRKALLEAKLSSELQLIQVDTPYFAYEPFLKRLQDKRELQLAEQLLFFRDLDIILPEQSQIASTVVALQKGPHNNLQGVLRTPNPVKLDESQVASLIAGLGQAVSLIQGPPGTGKSFIGALLAKVFFQATEQPILVICYTNHALDQFLQDLMSIGIPAGEMVRLGTKSSYATKHLSLFEQSGPYRRSANAWNIINNCKIKTADLEDKIKQAISNYLNQKITKSDFLWHLALPPEDPSFSEGLSVPDLAEDETLIGEKGKRVGPHYLLDRWAAGKDAGLFAENMSKDRAKIWAIPRDTRLTHLNRWRLAILQEKIADIYSDVEKYNSALTQLNDMLNEKNAQIIKSKRIVGCTTTGAAMYARELQAFQQGIVIVEEAGEVLESHVLTSIGPKTRQLVLIGDHKQLRPKVNNYKLTVERGEGYDLNRSLFERLIREGLPSTTLQQQHRMCPEISSLVRTLTYPDLLDAPSTKSRPELRGFQERVMFVDHNHLETELHHVTERRDQNAKSSRQNQFEVDMVLQCVRYLGQQGYRTENITILTPYLAQLKLLRDTLAHSMDPILNDLDSFDLVQAGLMPAASAVHSRRPIKISTIDNYQGEESQIIICSLTRSNIACDIGFMAAPERLNVLLSRARDGLILIGNSKTFLKSRTGKKTWEPLFEKLRHDHQIYEGFPVKCERHPDRKALIRTPRDFEEQCPDGGCQEPCGAMLKCGLHQCSQRCHQISDHSKMFCHQLIRADCPKKHKLSWECGSGPPQVCAKCEAEKAEQAKRDKRDQELELRRQRKEREYITQMAALEHEFEYKRQLRQDEDLERERQNALRQRRLDLENMDAISQHMHDLRVNAPQSQATSSVENSSQPSTSLAQQPTLKGVNQMPRPQISKASEDWERQKSVLNSKNDAIESLMGMIGLEEVKEKFLSVKAKVETVLRQNTDLKDERFGAVLLGNPGTGKTTVARLYAKLLASFGVLPGDQFIETTGANLANDGVAGAKKKIEDLLAAGGGAFFLDEAYQLVGNSSYGGKQVLDYLLAEMENQTGKIVFILAGYDKQMEAFFDHNPGLPSRIPIRLRFCDYSDSELQQILQSSILRKYQGKMKVEDGIDGLFIRIMARRVGKGRGREGFGNARAVQNMFQRITDRQAERLRHERMKGMTPDDFQFVKEDIIGPEPAAALKHSEAWDKLNALIGLETVKESVTVIINRMQRNYERELEEKPLIECSLNRVLSGSPGTGKTSVAKLYGQILADIGLLSSNEVVLKNPSDFVGSVLGQSEANTKAILASSMGKVLIIDEAYMLAGGSTTSGAGNSTDIYKIAVIDTIVAEVQSTAGEDRCVLLLGYKDQMEQMFQSVNPGLARRFPMSEAFTFEDYNDEQLLQIMDLKLKQQGFSVTDTSQTVAMEVLSRARNRPNFGNAGEIDIVLDRAKASIQKRLRSNKDIDLDVFAPEDFDPDYDRGSRAVTNCRELFKGVIGCEDVVSKLEGYQRVAVNMKVRKLDPRGQIPFSFLFKGPSGTGKTSTARRMGQIFYDMGFLASTDVVECSASDLIGQYVGHTGPKVQNLLNKALGRVLFIDEAYRLKDGQFAHEAINELVDALTKEKFANKLVTILAGYNEDINQLMSINPGLTSRFPEEITFRSLTPEECKELLEQNLTIKGIAILCPDEGTKAAEDRVLDLFSCLSSLPAWGNARDVQTIAKGVYGELLKANISSSALTTDVQLIVVQLEAMIKERSDRARSARPFIPSRSQKLPPASVQGPSMPTPINTAQSSQVNPAKPPPPPEEPETPSIEHKDEPTSSPSDRDPGVSDETWDALQRERRAAEKAAQELECGLQENAILTVENDNLIAQLSKNLVESKPDHERSHARKETARRIEEGITEERKRLEEEDRLERKHRHEQIRLQLEIARRKKGELEGARKRAEEQRKQEAKAQQKLRQMGICPAGYQWIKQPGGYLCAGGSHWVTDGQLGL